MKKDLEIKGYWFLPDQPDNRVAGILYYRQNKEIKLELIGSFSTPTQYLMSKSTSENVLPEIIHGESSDARKITLINCVSGGSSLNFSCSFPMQSYRIQYVLDGIYCNNYDDKLFNKATLNLPYLTSWINYYALNQSFSFKDDRMHGFQLDYSLDDANIIEVKLPNELLMEIEYVCGTVEKYNEEVTLKQSYDLKLISDCLNDFSYFIRKAEKFQDFLVMAALEDNDITSFHLYCPDLFQELTNGRKIYHPVKLMFVQREIEYKRLRAHDFLFDHSKIAGNLERILFTWYSFNEDMAPIMQHLIDSIQPRKIFSKADFLIVIQALEGFHTRFRNSKKINLKSRLTSIHEEFSFISSISEMKIDYQTAVDSRHYYSHFFHKSQKEHIADGLELYQLTTALKKLLICCVLRETAFDDDSLSLIINGDKRIV